MFNITHKNLAALLLLAAVGALVLSKRRFD